MNDKVIGKAQVAEFIHELMNESDVIAPTVTASGTITFCSITLPEDIRWEYGNTTIPPTVFLLPPAETMYRFEQRGADVSLIYQLDETRRTIVGIRPCDVHSIRILDQVFGGKYTDPYYHARRKHTLLIALMCHEPAPGCFCSSFGTGPSLGADSGADMFFVDLGTKFYVQALSEAGKVCLERFGEWFTDATPTEREAVAQVAALATSKIRRHLELEGLAETLAGMFDAPYWQKIAQKCLACGACTYLCPVCYCFDVADRSCPNQMTGERLRCWDACTFRSFAALSGGHNPRPTIAEGYRQKMYHKFSFAPERYGHPLCVGCGRCLDVCPVDMDIVRVLTEARTYAKEVQ